MNRGAAFSDAGMALLPAQRGADRSRREALALGAALLAILVVYLETAASIVEIWARSDTFAHGWAVLPIAVWLVWRSRDALSRVEIEPCYAALAAVGAAGFGWLLAELASVASVAQFALVLTIEATVLTVLGRAVTRVLVFPLAFLFFAVPVGEFMVPQLIEWTASFTVGALRLTGVPVYREGNHFVLPTGSWSVVEACSGIRYLAASVMAGTLYAYLTYRSMRRRLAFIAVAVAVPIVANWLRAYLIVILGHLSSGRLAAGVDHLIYGWVFFGLVIGVMFWMGSLWREEAEGNPGSAARDVSALSPVEPAVRAGGAPLAAVLAVLVAGVWPVLAGTLESTGQPAQLLPITSAAGWRADEARLAQWSPRFVGSRAQLQQSFHKEAWGSVGVYVAYYRGQTQGSELVSSENTLVGSTNRAWHEIHRGPRDFQWGTGVIGAPTSELVGPAQRLLVRRFYWIDGRLTANDYVAKGLLALAKLTGAGDGSAAIVLYTDCTDSLPKAGERLDRFATEMGSSIDSMLATAGVGER